jgi:hypothetical protein
MSSPASTTEREPDEMRERERIREEVREQVRREIIDEVRTRLENDYRVAWDEFVSTQNALRNPEKKDAAAQTELSTDESR